MAKQSLGKRILSAILALVIVIGACPIGAFATGTTASADNNSGVRLPFTKVDGVDADVLHDAAKVTQPKEEVPYEPTDVVRVSIVLKQKSNSGTVQRSGCGIQCRCNGLPRRPPG